MAERAGDPSKRRTPAERHALIGELFKQACRLDPEGRAEFLGEACGDDRELLS